ncbi:MAG: helix-turn-helix domain-containing protein [Ruminococcus sp.]|nr:helix-turn-helix domain-containing protein [Ruminococcus sp.]
MFYNEKLVYLREKNDITQAKLAEIAKLDKGAYCNYENETLLIPIKHLNNICNYFTVSLDYIFSFTNNFNYKNNLKEINKEISGKRLKDFRKENNLTLKKLGEILNISYGTLAGYEIGRYIIATPFLYTICSKYHISADYLLGKIDDPKYLN